MKENKAHIKQNKKTVKNRLIYILSKMLCSAQASKSFNETDDSIKL